MLHDYLEQLNSPDPQQRKAAIIALGKLRDPVALRPLAEVFRTDPDAQIRELALKAGRLIRGDSSERPASTAPISVPSPAVSKRAAASDDETPAKKLTPITQGAITSARQLTEDALSVNLRGDKSGAVKLLNKALSLNPTLIDDTYFRSVASAVLEVDSQEAIQLLHDKGERKNVVRATSHGHKQKVAHEHFEEVSKLRWSAVGLDVGLFALITVLGIVLGMVILRQSIEALLNLEDAPLLSTTRQQLGDYAKAMNPGLMLTLVALTLVVALISIFLQVGLMHVIARYILRGTGTFRYLLHKIISLYNRYLIVAYSILILSVVVVIGLAVFPLVYLFGLILGIFSLVTFLKMAGRISEAYHFGTGMGCVTLILSVVVITILNAAVGLALQNSLISLLPASAG